MEAARTAPPVARVAPVAAPSAAGARPIDTRREGRLAGGLIALGLVANAVLLWLFLRPEWKPLVGDERFYVPRIKAFAAGEAVKWDPLWPPFYIDAMGWLSRLVGGWHPVLVQAAQVALFFTAAWLFWRIARRLMPPGAALAALAFFVLMPDLAAYTGFQLAEVLHLFLALAASWLLLAHPGRVAALVAAGALLGLALASKLLLMAFVPVLLGAVAWNARGDPWRRAAAAAWVGAGIVLATLPFMARNERLHGAFTIADSTVLNRLIALRDRAPRDWQGATTIRSALDAFNASAPTLAGRNAIAREQLNAEIARRGLLRTYVELAPKQYQRLLHHETFFTSQLPGGPRAAFTLPDGWLSAAIRTWAHAAYAALLVAAALGLAAIRWTRPGGLHVAALFLLYNAAVFLVVITQTRYMVPVYPALMLFAGVGLHAMARRWRAAPDDPPTPFRLSNARLAFGLAGAAALLAVAFPELWVAWTA